MAAALPEIAVRHSLALPSLCPRYHRRARQSSSALAALRRCLCAAGTRTPLDGRPSLELRLAKPLARALGPLQDEILYMGFDAAAIGLPADFVLTDYSKVRELRRLVAEPLRPRPERRPGAKPARRAPLLRARSAAERMRLQGPARGPAPNPR
jgi:hypothetical protein